MYYLIYQITNKLNGKIYIGKHKTEDKNDDYMGSGKYLKSSQNFHGIENFEKTILFECSSEEEMNAKEREIVNEDFIARDDTYNIVVGGDGGWDYVNYHSDYSAGTEKRRNIAIKTNNYDGAKEKRRNAMLKWRDEMCVNNPEKLREMGENGKKILTDYVKHQLETNPDYMKGENNPMFGKHHSEETCKRLSETHVGSQNSMYGKMWIYNMELCESKMISKDEEIPEGWERGRHSKKVLEEMKNGTFKESRNKENREAYHNRKVEFANKLYDVFVEEGFDSVVEKFNYTHSRGTLVRMFKKYVERYVPTSICEENEEITYVNSLNDEKILNEVMKNYEKEEKIQKLVDYYTLLYNAYLEHGFDYIVKTFGYDKTRENLSRKFKTYVKEYSTDALLKATVALRKKNKDFKDSYMETLHMTEDEKIKLYSEMYADYKEKGFDFVVEKYDYRRTHGALLWNFRKFVKEYVPAPTFRWNGKGVYQKNTRKNEPK